MKTFYFTKRALTEGIKEYKVELPLKYKISGILLTILKIMQTLDTPPAPEVVDVPMFSYHKPDWHESKEEAIQQAEKMRGKKIIECQRRIKKLNQLKF